MNNRNTPRKLVWRAGIVLATAEGHGTFEIMRRTGMSKPTVWRWQGRYLDEGVAGLKRDKTRPLRGPPLPMETRLKVIARTVQETPPNATHWSRALMADPPQAGNAVPQILHVWMAVLAFSASRCIIGAHRCSEATAVAPMQYSQIIRAALLGWLFFNELPDLWTVLARW